MSSRPTGSKPRISVRPPAPHRVGSRPEEINFDDLAKLTSRAPRSLDPNNAAALSPAQLQAALRTAPLPREASLPPEARQSWWVPRSALAGALQAILAIACGAGLAFATPSSFDKSETSAEAQQPAPAQTTPAEPRTGRQPPENENAAALPTSANAVPAADPSVGRSHRTDRGENETATRTPRETVREPENAVESERLRERTASAERATESAEATEITVTRETSTAATEEAPDVEVGELPAREDVRSAMEGIRGAMAECAGNRHGPLELSMVVGSSGRVRSVRVMGSFVGTSEGSCMARNARSARFPPFTQPSFEFTYPYQL